MPDGDYKYSSWGGTNNVLISSVNSNQSSDNAEDRQNQTLSDSADKLWKSTDESSDQVWNAISDPKPHEFKYTAPKVDENLYDIDDYGSLTSPTGEHPYGYQMDFIGDPHDVRTIRLINSLNKIRSHCFEPHWKYLRPGVDFGKAVQKELKKFQVWSYSEPADGTLNWSTEQNLLKYYQDPYSCLKPGERYLADNVDNLVAIAEELLDLMFTSEIKQEISNLNSISVEEDVVGILGSAKSLEDVAAVYEKGAKNNLARNLALEEQQARKLQGLLQREIEAHESEIIRLMREMNDYLDEASRLDFDFNKKYTAEDFMNDIDEWGKYIDNEAKVKGLKNKVLDLQINKANVQSIGEKSIKELNKIRENSAPVSKGGKTMSALGKGGKALGWIGYALTFADVAVCAWAYRDVPTEENENNLIASIVGGAVSIGTGMVAGAIGGVVGGPPGIIIGIVGGMLYGVADLVVSGVRDDGKSLSLLIVEGTKRSNEAGTWNDLPCWEVAGPSAGL